MSSWAKIRYRGKSKTSAAQRRIDDIASARMNLRAASNGSAQKRLREGRVKITLPKINFPDEES